MGNEARHEPRMEDMALFSFTFTHRVYYNTCTVDSGKPSAVVAFYDIRDY
jgi:hypothetical protein